MARLAREILERCRGEGPANCVARCPLHVDARGYVQLTREGKFREALQLVREQLPFPGILGYVCAHPCEQHCKRIDDDDPVRIRDVKRFLAEWEPGPPQHRLDCEPARDKRVAIVGAGPAGLLAAHDLRRRGHAVTIFEGRDRLGGCLTHQIPPSRLPTHVVERDLSIIDALGIDVRLNVRIGPDLALDVLRHDYDAVLLLPGYAGAVELLLGTPELRRSRRETIAIDPVTGETSLPGVFAAGDAVSGPSTVIDALAHGRRAAESAHRFLSGEDIGADREPLLPRPLLWKLAIPEAERRQRQRTAGMLQSGGPTLSEAEATEESGRCLDCHCGLCVQDCEFLTRDGSPKELARRVLAGLEPLETRTTAYSCNICQLCATVCPEGLDTGRMMLEARREAVRKGLGPLPQHKPIVGYWKAGVSGPFTLAMAEPGRQRSRRLFFTGCSLPAVAPAHTLTVYDTLRRHYPGTGVLMYCCGAPADMLGLESGFDATRAAILRAAEELGAEELIAACPDCTHTLKIAHAAVDDHRRCGNGSPDSGRRRPRTKPFRCRCTTRARRATKTGSTPPCASCCARAAASPGRHRVQPGARALLRLRRHDRPGGSGGLPRRHDPPGRRDRTPDGHILRRLPDGPEGLREGQRAHARLPALGRLAARRCAQSARSADAIRQPAAHEVGVQAPAAARSGRTVIMPGRRSDSAQRGRTAGAGESPARDCWTCSVRKACACRRCATTSG